MQLCGGFLAALIKPVTNTDFQLRISGKTAKFGFIDSKLLLDNIQCT
jgi:hypothetical protein